MVFILCISIGIYLFCFGYSVSIGPIAWLYNAEILPDKGVSIATICNWLSVIIITLLFPVVNASIGAAPIFYFFSFTCIACLIFVFILIRETKGLNKRAISSIFYNESAESETIEDLTFE